MNREQLYYLRSEILDTMVYIHTYAPDFLTEDRTTLEGERDKVVLRMAAHRSPLRTDAQRTWHALAEQEFGAAIEAFSSGDGRKGREQMQRAEEHFQRSFKPAKKIRPDFIAGPDGQIIKL